MVAGEESTSGIKMKPWKWDKTRTEMRFFGVLCNKRSNGGSFIRGRFRIFGDVSKSALTILVKRGKSLVDYLYNFQFTCVSSFFC